MMGVVHRRPEAPSTGTGPEHRRCPAPILVVEPILEVPARSPDRARTSNIVSRAKVGAKTAEYGGVTPLRLSGMDGHPEELVQGRVTKTP